MKINEIFLSIDGEGVRSGLPTVFIRKVGCNCRCSYCDTTYSFTDDNCKDMTVGEIVEEVNKICGGTKNITFTGGEPLFYTDAKEEVECKQLLQKLKDLRYQVNVETNGSIDLKPWERLVKPQGFFTMDWKCKSSKMTNKMVESNLEFLDYYDVLKFVVGSEEDLNQMKDILDNYDINAQVFVSPVFGQIEPRQIVEFVLKHNLNRVRTQVQLHKIIWDPNMRGV